MCSIAGSVCGWSPIVLVCIVVCWGEEVALGGFKVVSTLMMVVGVNLCLYLLCAQPVAIVSARVLGVFICCVMVSVIDR